MKLKNQTTDLNSKKYSFLIIIGAIIACVAPFIHELFPDVKNELLIELKNSRDQGIIDNATFYKEVREVTVFGYKNVRKMLYAVGKPLSMLFFALLIFVASIYINDDRLKKTFKYCSFMCASISFYFIIWAIWYMPDLSSEIYYAAIAFFSFSAAYITISLMNSRNKFYNHIKILTRHIVIIGKRHVPEKDRKEYVKDYVKTFESITK